MPYHSQEKYLIWCAFSAYIKYYVVIAWMDNSFVQQDNKIMTPSDNVLISSDHVPVTLVFDRPLTRPKLLGKV